MLAPCAIVYAIDNTTLKEHRGNGFGVSYDNVCYTLNTVDRHMVAVCALTEEPRAQAHHL